MAVLAAALYVDVEELFQDDNGAPSGAEVKTPATGGRHGAG